MITPEQRVLEWVKEQSFHGKYSMFKISELENWINANTEQEGEGATDTDRMGWWRDTSIWWMKACQEAWKQRDEAWARIKHFEANAEPEEQE